MEGFEEYHPVKQVSLEGDDMTAHNSADNPFNVVPEEKDLAADASIVLSKASWNMICFEK